MVMLIMGVVLVFVFFFKQKTAYEIMPSLVGSEMCIRDSRASDVLAQRAAVCRTGRDDPGPRGGSAARHHGHPAQGLARLALAAAAGVVGVRSLPACEPRRAGCAQLRRCPRAVRGHPVRGWLGAGGQKREASEGSGHASTGEENR